MADTGVIFSLVALQAEIIRTLTARHGRDAVSEDRWAALKQASSAVAGLHPQHTLSPNLGVTGSSTQSDSSLPIATVGQTTTFIVHESGSGPPLEERGTKRKRTTELPPKRVMKPSEWQREAIRLFGKIPTIDQLDTFIRDETIALPDTDTNITVDAFTSSPRRNEQQYSSVEASTYTRAYALGTRTARSLLKAISAQDAARRAVTFARFQLLLFFTHCAVLKSLTRLSAQQTYEVMMETVPLQTKSKKRLERFMAGAIFMNHLIVRLCRAGMPLDRATAAVCYCSPTAPSSYHHINSEKAMEYILHELEHQRRDLLIQPNQETDFSIPREINKLDPDISIEEARSTLGYHSLLTFGPSPDLAVVNSHRASLTSPAPASSRATAKSNGKHGRTGRVQGSPSTMLTTHHHCIHTTPSTTLRQDMSPPTSSREFPTMGQVNCEAFEQPVARDESIACTNLRSPTLPRDLLIPEQTFHYIKAYFQESCRKMMFDDCGNLLSPDGTELRNDLCNNFDSYCFTATMFAKKGLFVEFGTTVSKAVVLIKEILLEQHPRTLTCFFEVFIHLMQIGLPELTEKLRSYIKSMSATVTSKESGLGQICRLIGELDSHSLVPAMAQLWKCITDTFDTELGPCCRLAISVRLDYIKRIYGSTDCLEEGRYIRGVLDRLDSGDGVSKFSMPRVKLNLAHNLNRQGRYNEAEKTAHEALSLLKSHDIYTKRSAERVECLKAISFSQFGRQDILAATQTLQEAIMMTKEQLGQQHPWVLEFEKVLEEWFRELGREEDANAMLGKIKAVIGNYEKD